MNFAVILFSYKNYKIQFKILKYKFSVKGVRECHKFN